MARKIARAHLLILATFGGVGSGSGSVMDNVSMEREEFWSNVPRVFGLVFVAVN